MIGLVRVAPLKCARMSCCSPVDEAPKPEKTSIETLTDNQLQAFDALFAKPYDLLSPHEQAELIESQASLDLQLLSGSDMIASLMDLLMWVFLVLFVAFGTTSVSRPALTFVYSCRYKYPPLANTAFELLIRYYTQREVFLEAASNLQILVDSEKRDLYRKVTCNTHALFIVTAMLLRGVVYVESPPLRWFLQMEDSLEDYGFMVNKFARRWKRHGFDECKKQLLSCLCFPTTAVLLNSGITQQGRTPTSAPCHSCTGCGRAHTRSFTVRWRRSTRKSTWMTTSWVLQHCHCCGSALASSPRSWHRRCAPQRRSAVTAFSSGAHAVLGVMLCCLLLQTSLR